MQLRTTRLTVHLGAYRHNLSVLRKAVAPAALMAVVKANAYGHGLVPIAKAAILGGTSWLGVATAEEGVLLREAGIAAPVLVLGTVNRAGATACVQHDLTITIATPEAVATAQDAANAQNRTARVHMKLDTGMGRIGLRTQEDVDACIRILASSPNVRLSGVFTHLADADNPDQAFTDLQLARFAKLRTGLPAGLTIHAAASAAALRRPDSRFDMVRIGIASYGYPTVPTGIALCPCLTWTAEVAFVKDIASGETVGYGCAYRADRPMKVATLAVGYGDGYPRALSGRAHVLLHGIRCSVIGRICMDQMMVDVTGAPRVSPGDEAVLLGSDGDETITADDLAAMLNTIPYEVLLLPGARVPVAYDEE